MSSALSLLYPKLILSNLFIILFSFSNWQLKSMLTANKENSIFLYMDIQYQNYYVVEFVDF
jgi:hypothetical protein